MGDRRRSRGRYDGDCRRGVLVEKHGLSISALAVALALALPACHQVETKQIFFRVTTVGGGCQILDCNLVTLQCIGSVRAVLTPENGNPVMGQCTLSSGVATTLCEPTRLFSKPLFDQVSEPR